MDISGQSKVKSVQINNNEFPPFVTTTIHPLKGLIDVNLSANYFITKNIGVFVDVNNLGFQKWPRFYKYPTYQFQVIGGVKLAF